ncbi:DUF5994 family protein [Spirillospora sp. CA-142024]|uniref:DUF5994 family protein n=1 Tax=Spirillospora sp. CA-142024 TaxID=3240036 RepID=UPI003D949D68
MSLSPYAAPRLALRPSAPADRTGPDSDGPGRTPLDGGWWPRSADPVAELPGLVLALQAHGPPDGHRPIAHIMLRAADWDTHPRRLRVEGPNDTREVRLSWFHNPAAGLLTAIYADGRRIDLLTVPAPTGRAAARAALELAAHPANHLSAPDLLAGLAVPADPHDPAWTESAAQSAWESEGGRLCEHPAAR